MSKRNGFNYFQFFREMTDCACQASEALNNLFGNYQPEKLREQTENIHTIEHAADIKKHNMMQHLHKEFLPPIDREDIVAISHVLDEVVDLIEEVVLSLYMNDIVAIRPDVLPICSVIARQTNELCALMREFENYKKSVKIMDHVVTINTLEEEADRLFLEAMRNLRKTCSGAMELIAWKEIYQSLEDCADACEKVADAVEEVVMKNT